MDTTEGLTRGQTVTDTGNQIQVPVGPATLGRILNVVGEPIDERGPVATDLRAPIHAKAPEFIEQSTTSAILVSPASRSSTCWLRTPRAARSACSAALASARRF